MTEIPGKPGAYRAVAFLKPHYQLDELTVSLRLVANLPPPAKRSSGVTKELSTEAHAKIKRSSLSPGGRGSGEGEDDMNVCCHLPQPPPSREGTEFQDFCKRLNKEETNMAFDAFIKIDGVPGESTDDKHKDWIEVLSYSWGVAQPKSGAASTAGGASAERADFQDFSIVKVLDKASPKLALACARREAHQGGHSGTLSGRRRQGEVHGIQADQLHRQLRYAAEALPRAERPLPLEEVAFNYGKIEWTYTQQKRDDGSGGGQVAAQLGSAGKQEGS